MLDASIAPSGTSASHGAVTSIRKKSAPLSRTVRRTSESASVATEPPRSGRRSKQSGRPVMDAAAAQSYTREKEASMSTGERGQVTKSAAEVYEEFFVPALFQEWAPRVADAVGLRTGERVLDVACGTGVLTRAAADRVGPAGVVVGLDVNDGMLEVARRRAPQLEWRQGRAEALPLEPRSFDSVVSQFGLMFFQDRAAAIGETMRVLRPDGRLALAVWDSLDRSPGYAALVALLQRLIGSRAANALRAPFVLGDLAVLLGAFKAAGIDDAKVTTTRGTARFPSIQAWMYADVRGWP